MPCASCNLAANNGNLYGMNYSNPSLHAVLPEFATRKAEESRNDLTINDSGSLEHLGLYVESAMCGDPIVDHCLATGVDTKPEESEPNTIKQAYALPDRAKWREAVDTEMSMIEQYRVFSFPMPLPTGAKALNCRWVFKRKRDQHGNVMKYKARLTPLGCFQHFGVDYADTYAPVARMCTLRYVLALACLLGLNTSS